MSHVDQLLFFQKNNFNNCHCSLLHFKKFNWFVVVIISNNTQKIQTHIAEGQSELSQRDAPFVEESATTVKERLTSRTANQVAVLNDAMSLLIFRSSRILKSYGVTVSSVNPLLQGNVTNRSAKFQRLMYTNYSSSRKITLMYVTVCYSTLNYTFLSLCFREIGQLS